MASLISMICITCNTNKTNGRAVKMKKKVGRYAGTVKVGEKGQIVIPKEARDLFGIQPGDTLILLADEKRGIALPPKEDLQKYLGKVFDEMGMEE